MTKKWAYYLAVISLLALRIAVLNTTLDETLLNLHYERAAGIIANLRASPAFSEFMSNWGLPAFVAAVLIFWATSEDDQAIPMQFLVLPIAYIPFSIIGNVLMTAEFRIPTLWIHPLVILPFGYFFVGMWTIVIWLLEKIRIVR